MCVSGGWYWSISEIIAAVTIFLGLSAHLASAARVIRLHRKHTKTIKPADPLKPYLM